MRAAKAEHDLAGRSNAKALRSEASLSDAKAEQSYSRNGVAKQGQRMAPLRGAFHSIARAMRRQAQQRHSDARPRIARAKDGSVQHRNGTVMDCKPMRGHSMAKQIKTMAKYGSAEQGHSTARPRDAMAKLWAAESCSATAMQRHAGRCEGAARRG